MNCIDYCYGESDHSCVTSAGLEAGQLWGQCLVLVRQDAVRVAKAADDGACGSCTDVLTRVCHVLATFTQPSLQADQTAEGKTSSLDTD